ncbi:zinc finger CHY domain-containing protein [Pyrenochaeta sp. DS3sAY3a]|nr:zinc finger CHY domain-containing protein [Pyrenochaeta sp. DS3sAY3a]
MSEPAGSLPDQPPTVHGISLTPLTQCTHYHSPLDIIAIQHFCCQKFYACISCHNAQESHAPGVWPKTQRDVRAVLCGQCKHVLSLDEYMGSGSKCTRCGSLFNPGCKNHWELYFELAEDEGK